MHIVMIDPSPTACHVVKRLLEREGLEVETFLRALPAIQSCFQRLPDALILAIQIPQWDGYAITQTLRAKKAFRPLPIIALSTSTRVIDRMKARLVGMNAYITKPFETIDLLIALASCLAPRRKNQ